MARSMRRCKRSLIEARLLASPRASREDGLAPGLWPLDRACGMPSRRGQRRWVIESRRSARRLIACSIRAAPCSAVVLPTVGVVPPLATGVFVGRGIAVGGTGVGGLGMGEMGVAVGGGGGVAVGSTGFEGMVVAVAVGAASPARARASAGCSAPTSGPGGRCRENGRLRSRRGQRGDSARGHGAAQRQCQGEQVGHAQT